MLVIDRELKALITKLNEKKTHYALCGDLAHSISSQSISLSIDGASVRILADIENLSL